MMSKTFQQTQIAYLDQFLNQESLLDFLRYTFSNCVQSLLRCTNHQVISNSNLTNTPECYLQQYFAETKNNFQVYNSVASRQLRKDLPTDIDQTITFQDTPKSWFIKTADFGDDSDRLLQRPDGEFTELMKEIACYHQKFEEGNERVIVLRPHVYTGYDIQITAAMQCLGYTREQFQYIAVQPLKLYAFHTPSQKITPIPDLPIDELLKTVEMDDLRWHSLRVPLDSVAPINISSIGTPTDSLYRVRATYHRCCELLDRANSEGTIQLDTSKPQQWEITNTTQTLSDIDWQDPNSEKLAQLIQAVPNTIEQSAKEIAPHLITQHIESISDICYAWFTSLTPTLETYILLVNLRNTFYELMTEILGISLPVS
jgi:arginyl-tRNA synthetase